VAACGATDPAATIHSTILAAGGGSVEESLAGRDLSFLLLHARRDEAVPVRATRQLADELRGAGAMVDIQELAFDGHQYDLPTWCAVFATTRTFLEERRGTQDGPA
jgi:predicted esterase